MALLVFVYLLLGTTAAAKENDIKEYSNINVSNLTHTVNNVLQVLEARVQSIEDKVGVRVM